MPDSLKKFEEKPYNTCLYCAFIGRRCDGPNFLSMDLPRLTEWCRMRKDYLCNTDKKWTNAYIAQQANLSKISVDRFISGQVNDLKLSTVAQIIKVLINGTWGQYPCAMDEWANANAHELTEKLNKAIAENKRLNDALEMMKEEYSVDMALLRAENNLQIKRLEETSEFRKEQLRTKDQQLSERADYLRKKDRLITTLMALLIFALLGMAVLLVVDFLNPGIGFIW